MAEWLWRQCGATATQYSRQREAIRPTDPPLSATRFINSKTLKEGLGGTLTMGRQPFVRSSVQGPLWDPLDVKIATSGSSVELHVVNFESRRFHEDDGRVRTASPKPEANRTRFFKQKTCVEFGLVCGGDGHIAFWAHITLLHLLSRISFRSISEIRMRYIAKWTIRSSMCLSGQPDCAAR